MPDPTRRVQQLISLAADSAASEEEARTAALQAVRIIRRDGLVVTTREEAQAPRGAYTSRQLGMGTPQLSPARSRVPTRTRELPPLGEGRAHVVDWDFKDEVPGEKRDPAFPTSLLALLKK